MNTNRPTEEQISQRAYALFIQHGSQPGNDVDDWLQAESELMMRLPVPTSAAPEPSQPKQGTGRKTLAGNFGGVILPRVGAAANDRQHGSPRGMMNMEN